MAPDAPGTLDHRLRPARVEQSSGRHRHHHPNSGHERPSVQSVRNCPRAGGDYPQYAFARDGGGNCNRALSGENEGARPFTFLCLAHCYAHKNIDILLDAARRLPNYPGKPAECLITVAPQQHPGARRLLERLDQEGLAGKIENIGPVPSEMLPQVYRRSDALIFPMLLESFSRTYLEALYFGFRSLPATGTLPTIFAGTPHPPPASGSNSHTTLIILAIAAGGGIAGAAAALSGGGDGGSHPVSPSAP